MGEDEKYLYNLKNNLRSDVEKDDEKHIHHSSSYIPEEYDKQSHTSTSSFQGED